MMYFNIQNHLIVTPFCAVSDSSVCLDAVGDHFAKYPERWQAAFEFLYRLFPQGQSAEQRNEVLKRLKRGKMDIADGVFATISDYNTKPLEQALPESHQRYVDIQYVAQGKECIGLTRDAIPIYLPYDSEKDIAFYASQNLSYHIADPSKFFVFFPSDFHAPGISISEIFQTDIVHLTPELVTKIVIKLLF